eukprot:3843481-Alexandrium_andersonii.AAC.1
MHAVSKRGKAGSRWNQAALRETHNKRIAIGKQRMIAHIKKPEGGVQGGSRQNHAGRVWLLVRVA